MTKTWTIRCKLKGLPNQWTILGENRKEPIEALMAEVEHAMSSPFGACVIPGTMEIVSTDGTEAYGVKLVSLADIVPADLLGKIFAKPEAPKGFNPANPFAGMDLPPFPGIDAVSLN